MASEYVKNEMKRLHTLTDSELKNEIRLLFDSLKSKNVDLSRIKITRI